MGLISLTTKVVGSDTLAERKILATDVNQIKGALQTGSYDIKPDDVLMEGTLITMNGGTNAIRYDTGTNKVQVYESSTWKDIVATTEFTATFTAGENIAIRDVVYLKVSDGKIYKASTTNSDWIGVAQAAISSAATGAVYVNGAVVGGFSSLTPGSWYGLTSTGGAVAIQTLADGYTVGIAISATQIKIIKQSKKDNNIYKLQNEKAINDVSATNSGVLAGSSQKMIDKFLDSTGQNNTVDTGNTTSIFLEGLYYICNAVSTGANFNEVTETYSSSSSGTTVSYMNIKILKTCYLNSVAKTSTCTATRFLLKLGSTTLETITFSGNDAVLPAERILTAGNTYSFIVDKNGASYTSNYVGSTSGFPITYTYTQITEANTMGASRTNNLNVINLKVIGTTYTDSIIQSAVATVPTGMTKVFVTPLMYEALSGSDNITADVSIDNGAHYTTAVPINTWTPITSANGTQLIVKANLLTNDGTTTPKVLGWRVLLE